MDRREDPAVTPLANVKSWIENAFQRVSSSIRQRRSQSQTDVSRHESLKQTGIRSAPELVMFGVGFPNLNRVRERCTKAFASSGFYGTADDHLDCEPTAVDESSDLLRYVNERKASSQFFQRKTSLTKVENESETNVGGRKRIRLSEVEVEMDNRFGCSSPVQRKSVLSYDSEVNLYWTQSFGIQHGSNISTCLTYGETDSTVTVYSETEGKCFAAKSDTLNDHTKMEQPDETFSNNYRTFCETLNNLQQEQETHAESDVDQRVRSFTFSTRKSLRSKKYYSCYSKENNIPNENTRVKLSLQYFKQSRQLRVIALHAETAMEENKKIFCKFTFTRKSSKQRGKTKAVRIESGRATFNKSFYMETEEDDLNGYTLRVKLCKVSQILGITSVSGKATIDLEDLDICLDTTLWVKLRQRNSLEQVRKGEELEITSQDRSIHAEALSMLQQTDDLRGLSPYLSRSRSLPRLSRYGVRK